MRDRESRDGEGRGSLEARTPVRVGRAMIDNLTFDEALDAVAELVARRRVGPS